MNSIKKISVASVHGKIKLEKGQKALIMVVMGVVTGWKSGISQFGEWTALKGQFKATAGETGEQFHSSICLLPEVALGEILASYKAGGESPLEFAVEVHAVGVPDRADESVTKYEYSAKWLLREGSDPFAALEARVKGLLPAPTAPADPAPVDKLMEENAVHAASAPHDAKKRK